MPLTRTKGCPRSRALLLGLVRDDLVLDLRVRRLRDDLLLPKLVLRLVRPPLDDLLRVGVADAGQLLELGLACGVEIELVGLGRFLLRRRGLREGDRRSGKQESESERQRAQESGHVGLIARRALFRHRRAPWRTPCDRSPPALRTS